MSRRFKWLVVSVFALLLIGAGVSVIGEAIIRKIFGEPYFWLGTFGLVLLNSGICLVAEAAIMRIEGLGNY